MGGLSSLEKEVEILLKTDGKRNPDLLFKITKVNSKIF